MKAFHCVLGINVKHAVPKNILKPIKYISFQESSFLIDMRLSVCLSVCPMVFFSATPFTFFLFHFEPGYRLMFNHALVLHHTAVIFAYKSFQLYCTTVLHTCGKN